jgi:hypothetical protein
LIAWILSSYETTGAPTRKLSPHSVAEDIEWGHGKHAGRPATPVEMLWVQEAVIRHNLGVINDSVDWDASASDPESEPAPAMHQPPVDYGRDDHGHDTESDGEPVVPQLGHDHHVGVGLEEAMDAADSDSDSGGDSLGTVRNRLHVMMYAWRTLPVLF